MKNLFFQELIEMMEIRFGQEIKDHVLDNSHLDHSGSFKTRDQYDSAQFMRMVANFGRLIQLPYNSTMRAFGRHLNKNLIKKFPNIFESQKDTFSLFKNFDVVLREVKKYFPESQIPKVTFKDAGPNNLTIIYDSELPLADVAEGMLLSTIDYYQEKITVNITASSRVDENKRIFTLMKIEN